MGSRPVPLVLFGLGAIGRELARAVATDTDPDLRVTGAVDSNPALVGRPLHALWSPRSRRGPRIVASLDAAGPLPAGGVLVHAAGSQLAAAAPHFEAAVRRRLSVVSSCEELLWPWDAHPALARRLHRLARENGVAVLGTGVNPGFVMDVLPVVASAACRDIRRIHVVRAVNVSLRRQPLQEKVGVGMTVGEFRRLARQGVIGHVGLPESARLIAAALGWRLDALSSRLAPVVGRGQLTTGRLPATARVRGLRQTVIGRCRGREVIRLDLTMARGVRPDHDEIRIDGTPPLSIRVEPGITGDEATVSALINGVFQVRKEPPGLVWNPDLRLPHGRIHT